MTLPVKVEDFASATDAALGLALQQAQDRLKTQIEMARGADSRAQNLLSVCAAFTGVAVAGALSALVNEYVVLAVAAGAGAAVWLVGALFALRSMTPVEMDVPGWPPSSLVEDFRAKKTYGQIVSDMLVHLDAMISDNRTVIAANAVLTRTSMLLLVAAPVAAALIGFLGYLIQPASG